MSENSPTRTSAPQPEAEPETISRVPDSLPAHPSAVPTATGPDAAGDPPKAADVVPDRIGEYLVVRKIGEGGMGSVYLAEDPKLGRKAAIKTMRLKLAAHKENRDRFVREARAAAAVEHDNIVPIWGVGEAADGTPYIAMPFLQGEMLDARLKRERVAPVGLILAVGRDVADGLAAAHAKSLIHRDIKPANIWLEGDPAAADPGKQVRRAKVLDFGLARSTDQEDMQLTATGVVLGTPSFMAPEQARGEAVDHRADLWSLGVTLYRMATGQLPFRGPNMMAVLSALASETPAPVCELNPAVPPALGALIDQLMQKDAALRPQTAEEVAEQLRQIAAEQPASAAGRPIPVLVLPDAVPDRWEGVTDPDATDEPVVREHAPKPRPKRTLLLPAVGVLALTVLCVPLAAVVVNVQTATGTLTVEVGDADADARFQSGRLVLVGADGKERYVLTPSERSKTIEAGAYTVRVEGADGLALDTGGFTLKKKGEVVVRVALDPKKVATKDQPKKEDVSPDRKAAEWALSVGARVSVRVDGDERDVRVVKDLPASSFVLTDVYINGSKKPVSDDDLASLGTCLGLTRLTVWSCPGVSDVGIGHLKSLRQIEQLNVGATQLTNVGLQYIKDMTTLRVINLNSTAVTNAGLAELNRLPNLTVISAEKTGITGAALAPFKGSKSLRELWLARTSTADADVIHLAALPALEILKLNETQLTDVGLLKLTPLKRLTRLSVTKTKVTAEGLRAFAKAMPQCQIVWGDGTIEPTEKMADRKAAEWVLSAGGWVGVRIDGVEREVRALKDLPDGSFTLTKVHAHKRGKAVSDEGLACLSGCSELTYITVWDCPLSDVGASHLQGLTKVENLGFGATRLTDAGLKRFKGMAALKKLYLNYTAITDAGLAELKSLPDLAVLHVARTKVTAAGLEPFKGSPTLRELMLAKTAVADSDVGHLAALPALETLDLDETQLGDTGLLKLTELKRLTQLTVTKTKITAEGVKAFAKAMPQCRIEWDGGVTAPTKKK
jgi:serine/threonine protein kinase/Leucine-rich repeat (LRR) protein